MLLSKKMRNDMGNKMWENPKGKSQEIFPHFIPGKI